jgi:hypothetical protein
MSTVILDGNVVRATSPEGVVAEMTIAELVRSLAPRRIDTAGVVMPDGTKLVYSNGRTTILVHETPPQPRNLMWIANKSKRRWGGAQYRQVRIALPYLIVMAVYSDGIVSDMNECFFRTAPIESENDEVFYPALLNCSRFRAHEGHPLSWICTQNLDRSGMLAEADPQKRYRVGLGALMRCLLETGFNFSSEDHEGDSWFSQSTKIDPRLETIEKWEQATSECGPLFVLDIPWIKTGMSVRQVVDRIFHNMGAAAHSVGSVEDIARLLFNQARRAQRAG